MSSTSPLPGAPASPSPVKLRAELEELIVADLRGPAGGGDEALPGRETVRDRYLVGMLAPLGTIAMEPARSDDPGVEGEIDEQTDTIAATSIFAPSSFGFSFAVGLDVTAVLASVSWGRYLREDADESTGQKRQWQRYPAGGLIEVPIGEGRITPLSPVRDQPGVVLSGRCKRTARAWLVDLFLVNEQEPKKRNADEAWLFQPILAVEATDRSAIFLGREEAIAKPEGDTDSEEAALDLLYRDSIEFAVGHGVAVTCTRSPENPRRAIRIETAVVPAFEVPLIEAPSAESELGLSAAEFDMKRLAELDGPTLVVALSPLVEAYGTWLDGQEKRVGDPAANLAGREAAAAASIAEARRARDRLASGVALLGEDPVGAEAFRFANRVMYLQRVHTLVAAYREDDPELRYGEALARADVPANHTWRPFQLAFVLLNLPALSDPKHVERRPAEGLVDLLFFPTGGGKTEAYLGLTAFTLAIRRLQGVLGGFDGSDGVGVLMRYTLRLLTAQQFQRAATLISACEIERRERAAAGDGRLGATPFRIGMWVGGSVAPNRVAEARDAVEKARGLRGKGVGGADPLQIISCPWCGGQIEPGRDTRVDSDLQRFLVFCGDPLGQCPFAGARSAEGIPVVTTDEEIYRLLPGLLIATVDKFAQLPWHGPLRLLFGKTDRRCERHGYRTPDMDEWTQWGERDSHNRTAQLPAAVTVNCGPLRPPDLVIQDELHLISGPLGTLTGLYETAIDRLSAWDLEGSEVRPKVVASTATIRRAADQVHAVFWRRLAVFPPQVLDAGDSFFARRQPRQRAPGRRYIGICAPGARLKAVENRVFVAALGAAQQLFEKYGAAADPWMTLVGYFNALRELGGMRRLVDDDVSSRLQVMTRPGLSSRRFLKVEELTSRIGSSGIPEMLKQLGTRHEPNRTKGSRRPIDVLLATNMISVGIDVPRLGLMTVVGQPKTTAEYIQATSRIGRSADGPGLVLMIYNWARPRDFSHYERFEHYHDTFYRHVESLSVTPFAPRALDRGLSAVLAALVRQQGPEWNANGSAQSVDLSKAALVGLLDEISRRGGEVAAQQSVAAHIGNMINARLDNWSEQKLTPSVLLSYAEARDGSVALLQRPTTGSWTMWSCPMSLREVEPGINLILDETDVSERTAPAFVMATRLGGATPTAEDDDVPEPGSAEGEALLGGGA